MSDSSPIHLFKLVPVNAQTISNLQYSSVIDLEEAISAAFQIDWISGSSLAGSVYLEASNTGTSFIKLDTSELTISGASGSHLVNLEKPAYSMVRVCLNVTAGSAIFTVTANAKCS